MSKNDLLRIGNLVGSVKALGFIRAWKKVAGPIFGAKVLFHGVQKDPKGGRVLILDLQDPIWKQELLFESEKLLELYRAALQEEGIPSQEWPNKISLSPGNSLPLKARHTKFRGHKVGLK
jgi:hypothetical protein